jgi:hypothetical protein
LSHARVDLSVFSWEKKMYVSVEWNDRQNLCFVDL